MNKDNTNFYELLKERPIFKKRLTNEYIRFNKLRKNKLVSDNQLNKFFYGYYLINKRQTKDK
jgi:hypothetical protein